MTVVTDVAQDDGGGGPVVKERARPATLEEVARVAGLSRATVSRVVNGSPKVSEQAKLAVEAAIEQLGYIPNRAARTLVTRRTDSIGLVVGESDSRVFGEPFFAGLIRGVSVALSSTGIQLVLLVVSSDQERSRVTRYLGTHVDGAILVSVHAQDPLFERLVASGVPTVAVGRPPPPVVMPYVDADNMAGGRLAVEHLLGRGRSRIATVTGPQDMAVGCDRLAGYRAALAGAGVPPDEARVAFGDFSSESGARGTAELLARAPDIDAVFAASDLMAAGVLRALEAAGRRVPDDVAVVGFDDSVVATSSRPALTSVRQPLDDIGRASVATLRALLDDPGRVTPATVLPVDLTVRDSS